MKNSLQQSTRIELVDALRGFALLAIILVHNVEHFDIDNIVNHFPPFLQSIDNFIRSTIFFLFGGKAYAMFALLFGFSFFIQFESRKKRGENFAGRFAWRLVLLFCFGVFHVLFYSGEILSCYALVGFFIIPFRNASNRMLLCIAIICLLQPYETGKIIYSLINPAYVTAGPDWSHYEHAIEAATTGNSLWDVMCVNIKDGMISAHLFAWYSGRYFQTLALFLLGILLGRKSLFIQSAGSKQFWQKICLFSLPAFLILYSFKRYTESFGSGDTISLSLQMMSNTWSNFAFMLFLVSSFILVWFNTKFIKIQTKLVPYGRMSLSNYITSSITGSVLYYHYGLGLWDKLGTIYSLLVGIVVFLLQLYFSRWWLSTHRQGPLEKLWYRITWLGVNKK